jgi:pyruvate kinase
MRKTKIIATIGPASNKQATIEKMVKAGINVCRLNFSFGTQEEHFKTISAIRKASKKLSLPIAIMQDLQGPKIRIGKLKTTITVKKGDKIILSGNIKHKEKFYLPTTYPQIASDTKAEKIILIADGKIILKVLRTDKSKKEVHCKVIEGGTILTGKGINLPYTNISLPSMTEKDMKDAIFGAKAGVDYVSLSFVRKALDIVKLRKLLKKHNSSAAIISKIEKPEAVDNIDAIIEETDGIMIARGDLADEVSFAKVPLIQKEIIRKANKKGKFTIIATEMLSSMTANTLPTRAEVSDVANGVLDGTDLIMLSNETAMGKYPVESVRTMAKIAEETESTFTGRDFFAELELPEVHNLIEALCYSATSLSYDLSNEGIAVFTETGLTAKILSKFRPEATIFAVTYKEDIYQKMALYNNVYPILLAKEDFWARDVMQRTIPALEEKLHKKHLINKGRKFIVLTGEYIDGKWTNINTLKIKTFGV